MVLIKNWIREGGKNMKFDVAAWAMDPFVLMFISVFTGMLFGKIKFGKFNFGVSGTLFTGLLIGWWVMGYGKSFTETDAAFGPAQSMMKAGVVDKGFFTVFLVLFVAAVGLLAAKDMGATIYSTQFPLDLLNKSRTADDGPDLGAYERIEK